MGKTGKIAIQDLKRLQKRLDKLQDNRAKLFVDACAKELAARLLAGAARLTPVGDYSKEIEVTAKRDSKKHKKGDVYTKKVNPSGKLGGTLRRGWTSQSHEEAAAGSGKCSPGVPEAAEYVARLPIKHNGDILEIEIINPVEYAEYVEFGHRTANHRGWVPGQFMLTLSEKAIQEAAPGILELKIKKFLEDCMRW